MLIKGKRSKGAAIHNDLSGIISNYSIPKALHRMNRKKPMCFAPFSIFQLFFFILFYLTDTENNPKSLMIKSCWKYLKTMRIQKLLS
jgi:hypothetical protein